MRHVALAMMLAAISSSALGTEDTRYDLRVTAVALGSRVFDIDASAVIGPKAYLVEAALRTAGVVDAFARSDGTFRAIGRVDTNGLNPEQFTVRSVGSSGERVVNLAWDNFGLSLVDVRPPPAEEGRDVVPPDLLRGIHDLPSAILERLASKAGVDPCSGTVRVFDGRRRFDLHLHWGPDDVLKAHRYSGYAGPAKRCLARLERIAGYLRRYEDQARAQPPAVYTVWLIEVPDRRMLLPVRLRSETWFGGFTAYVGSASENGKALLPPLAQSN